MLKKYVLVTINEKDILNNIGLPNLADKEVLTHFDFLAVNSQVIYFKRLYGDSFINHNTYKKAILLLNQLRKLRKA